LYRYVAVSQCRERRSCVEPNPGFIAALRKLADTLQIDDDTPVAGVSAVGGIVGDNVAISDDDGGGWGAQLQQTRRYEESAAASAAAAKAAVAAMAAAMAAKHAAEQAAPKVEDLLCGYMDDDDADADVKKGDAGDDARPRIEVFKGSDLVETIPLSRGGGGGGGGGLRMTSYSVSFGRDRECNVPLNHPSVSRRHADVALTDGRCYVSDNNSAHGKGLYSCVESIQVNT
jgi:hypothetical protein